MRPPENLDGKLLVPDQAGVLRPGCLVWHAGLAAWLLAAGRIYQEQTTWPVHWLASAGALLAMALWIGGLHENSAPRRRTRSLLRLLAGLGVIVLLRLALGWIVSGEAGLRPALWFGLVLLLLALISRRVMARLGPAEPARRETEAWRWLLLAGLVTWVYAPLLTGRPSGGSDANWYKFMLADFITQARTTGLPVWAGQTEYAFNGAVLPLRVAPWFQHAGALADWLTARSLGYVALSNLVLTLNALAAAFSAYLCFRALLPRQPWGALALAFIYAASPAILSPVCIGDQYMTFLTAPFLPVAALALWRISERDVATDYLRLAAALAALWLTHAPIALCLSFLSTVAVALRLMLRRGFKWRNAALALVAFLALGSLPFVSALSLGTNAGDPPSPGQAVAFNLGNFPHLFLPVPAKLANDHPGYFARYYQPGHAALLLGALALAIFAWRRTLSAGVQLGLLALCLALLLPIPALNAFLWHLVPSTAMQVLGTWPVQRLAGICVILLLTAGAGSLALLETAHRRWLPAVCCWGLLLPAAIWTGVQSSRITRSLENTVPHDELWRLGYEKHNVVLSRYAFNPFPVTPGYFSHGYMDPNLEHRLLRRDLTVLAANATSAVRRGPLPAPDQAGTARVAEGTWRAINDNRSAFYNLSPRFALPAHQHLALWVEPLDPGRTGWLQIRGQDVFRQYILPDSGTGTANRPTPRGFGTLPDSSRVIPLFTRHPEEVPLAINITAEPTPDHADFDFARYELWRYDPADLPVVLKSWVPYHVQVRSPEPAYLETPRAWLPHYRGRINGRYVPGERSPDGLVMFPVNAGFSDITIKYIPPLWLELTCWLNTAGWAALLGTGLAWLFLVPPRPMDNGPASTSW